MLMQGLKVAQDPAHPSGNWAVIQGQDHASHPTEKSIRTQKPASGPVLTQI